MSAGLPGLGLGGLFFIFSALLAPFGELWRTLRGRNRPGEWRVVWRQFAQAATMVIAIDLTLRLAYVGLAAVGVANVPPATSGTVLPLTLMGITSALLVLVLVLAKLAELRLRLAGGERPLIPQALPRPHPARALAYFGAAAIAWIALLSVGTAELSPLSRSPADSAPAERPGATVIDASVPTRARSEERELVTTTDEGGLPGPSRAASPSPKTGGSPAPPGAQPPVPEPSVPVAGAPEGTAPVSPPHGNAPSTVPVAAQGPPHQPPVASAPLGPPANAGPPEGTPSPEQAGPPESSPAPEHAGPPEHAQGAPAPEHPGPGKP